MFTPVPVLLFMLAAPQPTLAELFAGADSAPFLAAARPLAEKGHPEAQFLLGKAYHSGKGMEADLEEAEHWYRLAAAQHHPRALNNLGLLEIHRRAYAAARAHLEEALALGLKLPTLYNLGTTCTEGEWRSPNELEQGAAFFLQARAEGYGTEALDEAVRALVVATVMQQPRGGEVASPHYLELQARILKLGEEAKVLKLARSLQNVGVVFYESGRFSEALPWIRGAADLAQPTALYTLGLMAQEGKGLPKDPGAAEVFFEQAARLRQTKAKYEVQRHWSGVLGMERSSAALEKSLAHLQALDADLAPEDRFLGDQIQDAQARLAVFREVEGNARRRVPLPPGPLLLALQLFDVPPEEGGVPLSNMDWRVFSCSPEAPADGYRRREDLLAEGRLDEQGRTHIDEAMARRLRSTLEKGETLVFGWPGQRRLLEIHPGPKGEVLLGLGKVVR